jgi:replicative DNA helicase
VNHEEGVFYSHLTSADSLDVIAAEGFTAKIKREVIPTQAGRDITAWCLEYFFENGRKVAPTREAIEAFWGDEMEASDVTIEDDTETDSVQWAIKKMRTEYARWRSEQLLKKIATDVNSVAAELVVESILNSSLEFWALAQSLTGTPQELDAHEGLVRALQRHQDGSEAGEEVRGLTFGMPLLDEHLRGIRPGELAILSAFSGVGKSWMTLKPLIAEWKRGRRCVLFTLENDLDMTFDRMACVLAKVDYSRLQRFELEEDELLRIKRWVEKLKGSEHAPIVIMPQPGEADPASLVRKAQLLNADSIIIDQTSHVEPPPGLKAVKRNEIVQATVTALTKAIRGQDPVPCLLMHQIKREGNERARKTGSHLMEDLAESSQMEREATWIGAIYVSEVMKATESAQLQELKFRRGVTKNWEMAFRLGVGDMRVLREVEPEDAS